MVALAPAFFLTAALYASVGFGGGSTYAALLALAGVDYRSLPIIALVCNIIVVTGGSLRYARAGLVPWRRAWPFFALSAPMAAVGGATPVSERLFLTLLTLGLAACGLVLLARAREDGERAADATTARSAAFAIPLGAGVGFFSGVVGIGGGIFLAPLLHLARWAPAKAVAATASVFILINSLSGLAGQLAKRGGADVGAIAAQLWPLALAVLMGGQLGSVAGLRLASGVWVRRATAVLVLVVAARLAWRLAGWPSV